MRSGRVCAGLVAWAMVGASAVGGEPARKCGEVDAWMVVRDLQRNDEYAVRLVRRDDGVPEPACLASIHGIARFAGAGPTVVQLRYSEATDGPGALKWRVESASRATVDLRDGGTLTLTVDPPDERGVVHGKITARDGRVHAEFSCASGMVVDDGSAGAGSATWFAAVLVLDTAARRDRIRIIEREPRICPLGLLRLEHSILGEAGAGTSVECAMIPRCGQERSDVRA